MDSVSVILEALRQIVSPLEEAPLPDWLRLDSVKTRNPGRDEGWKLHLAFEQSDADRVYEVLKSNPFHVHFKVGRSSEQEGKDATVYVGSKGKAQQVAEWLEKELRGILKHPHGDTLSDDVTFTTYVMGRFDIRDPMFHQYGSKGIPFLHSDIEKYYPPSRAWEEPQKASNRQHADKVLTSRYGKFYTG